MSVPSLRDAWISMQRCASTPFSYLMNSGPTGGKGLTAVTWKTASTLRQFKVTPSEFSRRPADNPYLLGHTFYFHCISVAFIGVHSCGKEEDQENEEEEGKKYNSNWTRTKCKTRRTTFTNNQLRELKCNFTRQKYLTKLDRCALAERLGLTEKHVKTWYQNRRTKWKKECIEEIWSKERETAAANMYRQHLQLKRLKGNFPVLCNMSKTRFK